MKPSDFYCTLDVHDYIIVEVFIDKTTAQAHADKTNAEWIKSIPARMRRAGLSRYWMMPLDRAIDEIRAGMKEKYQQ